MSKSLEMVKLAKTALEDKKAGDIKVIDISGVSVLADYFLIANGKCKQMEGYGTGGWILMDYGDIIVHAFCREDRLFYDLERIWRDGKVLDESELR